MSKQLQLPGIRRYRKRPSNRPPRFDEKRQAKLRHVSNEVYRCRTNLSERVFAEEWIKACRWFSSGGGILDLLIPYPITQREAEVAATVVQWLGTNCGTSFLSRCLNRFGEQIVQSNEANDFGRNNYNYSAELIPTMRLPGAWQLFASQKMYQGDLRERAAKLRADVKYQMPAERSVKGDELHKRISERKPGEFRNLQITKRLMACRERLGVAEPELKVLV